MFLEEVITTTAAPETNETNVAALIFRIVWFIICAIGYWRMFTKMGIKGWKSLIPFYGTYERCLKTWTPAHAQVLLYLSILSILLQALVMVLPLFIFYLLYIMVSIAFLTWKYRSLMRLSVCFGHTGWYALGLFLLEPIFVIVLGFSKTNKYLGNIGINTRPQ